MCCFRLANSPGTRTFNFPATTSREQLRSTFSCPSAIGKLFGLLILNGNKLDQGSSSRSCTSCPFSLRKRSSQIIFSHFRKVLIAGINGLIFGKLSAKLYLLLFRYVLGERNAKSTVPDADGNSFTEEGKQVTTESGSTVRSPSQMPVSSLSTEESISAFIERTVSSLELPSQESELTDLAAPSPATVTTTSHAGLLKVSVSEPIVVNQDLSTEKSAADDNAETTSQHRKGPLYADTSDVEK